MRKQGKPTGNHKSRKEKIDRRRRRQHDCMRPYEQAPAWRRHRRAKRVDPCGQALQELVVVRRRAQMTVVTSAPRAGGLWCRCLNPAARGRQRRAVLGPRARGTWWQCPGSRGIKPTMPSPDVAGEDSLIPSALLACSLSLSQNCEIRRTWLLSACLPPNFKKNIPGS